jgi:hypothetical protein
MTVEKQRQVAKELVKYFQDQKYDADVQAQRYVFSLRSEQCPTEKQATGIYSTSDQKGNNQREYNLSDQ